MLPFDETLRTDQGPPRHGEANFAYLNRSGRPEARCVRALIESWLTMYPETDRAALVARLASSDNNMHASASFELLMCALIVTRGHKVVEIEPTLSHTEKSPDFLVETSHGHKFYIECAVATGRSVEETAADNRLAHALRVIDATDSPHHFLDLTVEGVPSASLTTSRLKRQLAAWVVDLPHDRNVFDEALFVFEEHGVRIVIRPWLRNMPNTSPRSTGVRHFPVKSVTPDRDVKGALKGKATRYGALDLPYLVAVNALERFADKDSAVDALFGTQATIERHSRDGKVTTEQGHLPDGLWHGKTLPQRTGMSGVVAMHGVDPWNFAMREPQLIRNPWASRPLPDLELGTPVVQFENGIRNLVPGRSLGELFSLPVGWPEQRESD